MKNQSKEIIARSQQNAAALKRTVADSVGDFIMSRKSEIAKILPKAVSFDRLATIALMQIRNTPQLAECSMSSLVFSLIEAMQLGLDVGVSGEAYLVPFNKKQKDGSWSKEAQMIEGYRGLCKLIRQSGEIEVLEAHPVYEKDTYRNVRGFKPLFEHEPAIVDRGELIGFYAMAKGKSVESGLVEFMSVAEVESIKARSKAGNNGPWVTDFVEMGRKTVLKRLAKYLPLSTDSREKIYHDEQREFGDVVDVSLGETRLPVDEVNAAIDYDAEAEAEIAKKVKAEREAEIAKMNSGGIEAEAVEMFKE